MYTTGEHVLTCKSIHSLGIFFRIRIQALIVHIQERNFSPGLSQGPGPPVFHSTSCAPCHPWTRPASAGFFGLAQTLKGRTSLPFPVFPLSSPPLPSLPVSLPGLPLLKFDHKRLGSCSITLSGRRRTMSHSIIQAFPALVLGPPLPPGMF